MIETGVKSVIKELRQLWPEAELPDELFHYTTSKGLLGILESKCFWATDINFLNDAMELKYALDLISRIFDAQISDNENETVREFLEHSKRYLTLHSSLTNAYVICFCEKNNLLSQWRAYSASGAGYAIGVVTESLKSKSYEGPGFPIAMTRLQRILYERNTQERLVTITIDRFCHLLLSFLGELDDIRKGAVINDLANYLSAELSEFLYWFKSSVFEEEREWRVIRSLLSYATHDDENCNLRFRVSGGIVIPYVELEFAQPLQPFVARGFPIRSVTFGPNLHPELTQRSLNVLLCSKFGIGNGVSIRGSDISLRIMNS